MDARESVPALRALCHVRCTELCSGIRREDLFWKCYDDCYHKCMEGA